MAIHKCLATYFLLTNITTGRETRFDTVEEACAAVDVHVRDGDH